MRGLVLVLLLAPASTAAAEPVRPTASELTWDPVRDGAITSLGAFLYLLAGTPFEDALAPDACRWCAPPGLDATARDALKWADPGLANQGSSWVGFVALPVTSLGLLGVLSARDHRRDEWLVDALIVAESVVLTMDVTQVVKAAVGRERPWIHALPAGDKRAVPQPSENNLSFYSGHASFAFALATSAGVVASRRGYRGAAAVWASGLALAATTGYLRIAADRHWTSDVVVGAAVGAAAGLAVPRLLHTRRRRDEHRPRARLVPTLGGLAVVGRF